MMFMRKTTYILLLLLLTSCDRVGDTCADHIGLKASIGLLDSKSHATRAAVARPFEGTAPTPGNPLHAGVWFSLDRHKFIHEPAGSTYLPCHTEMTFTSDAATYADYTPAGSGTPVSLKYPTDNNQSVYSVGFHPATGWNTADGVQVTHEITGSEDLMFADVIEGTWNTHFSSQHYSHILTWVKVSVCAMTMETASQWGKVTDIKISSKSNVSIDLSKDSDKISYSGSTQISAYNGPVEGTELNLTSTEVGSVFCIPETKDNKAVVTVSITTSNYGTKTLEVPLSDLDYVPLTSADQTVGKLFILSLYFNPFALIEGTCTLNYWNDQNEDLYLTPTAQ